MYNYLQKNYSSEDNLEFIEAVILLTKETDTQQFKKDITMLMGRDNYFNIDNFNRLIANEDISNLSDSNTTTQQKTMDDIKETLKGVADIVARTMTTNITIKDKKAIADQFSDTYRSPSKKI